MQEEVIASKRLVCYDEINPQNSFEPLLSREACVKVDHQVALQFDDSKNYFLLVRMT